MGKKILNIVQNAYRATLEEQDDPALWLCTALRGNGLDVNILLRGNAVCYGIMEQDASGLAFGARRQTQPPRLAADVQRLIDKGARVWFVEDDAVERGIGRDELLPWLSPVAAGALDELLAAHDEVWMW